MDHIDHDNAAEFSWSDNSYDPSETDSSRLTKTIPELSMANEELLHSRRRIVAVEEAVRREIALRLHGSVQNRLIVLVERLKQFALDAPAGDIILAICRRCHFVCNFAFDAEKVQFTEYIYSKYHSATYRNHVDEVIGMLVDTYELRHKMLIDVGCGAGYFLDKLSTAADSNGVGIDPSLTVTDHADESKVRVHYRAMLL